MILIPDLYNFDENMFYFWTSNLSSEDEVSDLKEKQLTKDQTRW